MLPTLARQGCSDNLILVSGGQSGVDRAVLNVGLHLDVPVTGWCPAGRWAEDGPIPHRYPLRATPTADTAQRTIWNVHLSDALLVLNEGYSSRGTALAVRVAEWLKRPVYRQRTGHLPDAVVDWLGSKNLQIINVAGPRHSEAPDIYAAACDWLEQFVVCYRAAKAKTPQSRSTSAGVL